MSLTVQLTVNISILVTEKRLHFRLLSIKLLNGVWNFCIVHLVFEPYVSDMIRLSFRPDICDNVDDFAVYDVKLCTI